MWADEQELDVPADIEARIAFLRAAPADGLKNQLFWPSLEGRQLELRSDFSLIDGALESPAASQADLFAVICTLLTNLRNAPNGSRKLANTSHERSVLAPSNFDRFNDGVLQACLLRSSRPKELAYGACDPAVSGSMLEILLDSLPDPSRMEKSEGVMEFLVALLTRRLTLKSEHLAEYLQCLQPRVKGVCSAASLMVDYIQAQMAVSS